MTAAWRAARRFGIERAELLRYYLVRRAPLYPVLVGLTSAAAAAAPPRRRSSGANAARFGPYSRSGTTASMLWKSRPPAPPGPSSKQAADEEARPVVARLGERREQHVARPGRLERDLPRRGARADRESHADRGERAEDGQERAPRVRVGRRRHVLRQVQDPRRGGPLSWTWGPLGECCTDLFFAWRRLPLGRWPKSILPWRPRRRRTTAWPSSWPRRWQCFRGISICPEDRARSSASSFP